MTRNGNRGFVVIGRERYKSVISGENRDGGDEDRRGLEVIGSSWMRSGGIRRWRFRGG